MSAVARRLAGEAWAFRARVEEEAALRFDRLATDIRRCDPHSPVPELLTAAADDERRHTGLCAELARGLGVEPGLGATEAVRIAPRRLSGRDAALYELVAASCITETESMGTLTTLLAADVAPDVRAVLHAIARDEVGHARLGWAHLAREAASGDVTFLAPLVPAMLGGTVDDALFDDAHEPADPAALLALGVLPHRTKRTVFLETLTGVVFPGLERFGVDAGPARAWLEARTAVESGVPGTRP